MKRIPMISRPHSQKRSLRAGAGRIADIVLDHQLDAYCGESAVDRFQCFISFHEDTSRSL
ncbi:MAG: hypothetical protein ABSB79_13755 [Syntrophales bacterium]